MSLAVFLRVPSVPLACPLRVPRAPLALPAGNPTGDCSDEGGLKFPSFFFVSGENVHSANFSCSNRRAFAFSRSA